jgi:hypothetical protein
MTLPSLHHRRVRESDRETLLAMRKECGWGTDRIDSFLFEPSMTTYHFYRESEAGEEVPVGMGCLTFDLPKDPDMASRERGIIAISKHRRREVLYLNSFPSASVFVFNKERGSGVGNRIFSILEGIAVQEHHAKTLAVDTRAFKIAWACQGEPSYLKRWYERLGYVEFRVSPAGASGDKDTHECSQPAEPRYPQDGHPDCRDSPDKNALIYACFLRKEVV